MIHEVVVGGNLALMDELVAPEFINHTSVETGENRNTVGVESFRQEIRATRSALSDLAVEIIHLLADGDYVIAHVRNKATHTGVLGGIPASRKRVETAGMSIVRFTNGKLAERWNLIDRYAALQQVGVIPNP
jgi:predicted ester cyclase